MPVTLSPETIALVRWSGTLAFDLAPDFARRFYENLFEIDPEQQAFFPSDVEDEEHRLAASLALMLRLADRPRLFSALMADLGGRHMARGMRPVHFATLGHALLITLHQVLGPAFSAAAERAWVRFYALAAVEMAGRRRGPAEASPAGLQWPVRVAAGRKRDCGYTEGGLA